jgi:hypothetical protein
MTTALETALTAVEQEELQFRAHTGELVTGQRLADAIEAVATDWENLARAIRKEDAYASHVAEQTKEENMLAMIEAANNLRADGPGMSFTFWQRINTRLTGECVALLPK